MKKEDREKLVEYWQKTAKHDYKTMRSLFESKRYDASLFFGHIVLEKILKALIANNVGEHAPRTHNLPHLAKISGVILEDDESELLEEVSEFNIEARYPEWKLEFYRRCTLSYSRKYFMAIESLYKKLCRMLKPKK
jgi:HEPN domain-containing protein